MAFSPRIGPWSTTIKDTVVAALSIANIEDPTEAPKLQSDRDTIVGILQQVVHGAADLGQATAFVDLMVSTTIALPIADRVPFVSGMVVEAIQGELGAGVAGTPFAAIVHGIEHNPEVQAAVNGVHGETPEEYNNKLQAYFTVDKLAELAAAATPTPTPVPTPAAPHAATPGTPPGAPPHGGGGGGAHPPGDGAHPKPPEDDAEHPQLVVAEERGNAIFRLTLALVTIGIAVWLISTGLTLMMSANEYSGEGLVKVGVGAMVGWVLIFVARLFATMLDKARGFDSVRQGEEWYFFRTANLVSLIATGLTFLLIAGVTFPAMLGGGSAFLSGEYLLTVLAVTMWGELTRRHFQARWTIIQKEEERSTRQRKLHEADQQYRTGRTIFWVAIVVSLIALSATGYGKAAYRHFGNEEAGEQKERVAAREDGSACEEAKEGLAEAGYTMAEFADMCRVSKSSAFVAECRRVVKACK